MGMTPRASWMRGIWLLGLTSLFTDMSADMIVPLLPLFLTAELGASPMFLGALEGMAEALSSSLKLASGWLSDRTSRRKPLVVTGYALASVVRPLMAFATLPVHVLLVRLADRTGKGIRTAPRDALIADTVPASERGRAYGIHRAMDHAGAMTGPLIATALLSAGFSMRGVFALAAVPAALAVLAVLWVREPPRKVASVVADESPSVAPNMSADLKPRLPQTFLGFLAVLLVFSLGNASDAFLILRASESGVSAAWIPLMWSAMHAVKLATSWACGSLSDRRGRVPLIATGWLVHVACFAALAWTTSPIATCVLAALHGVVAGLTEPSERALVGDLVPDAMRGRAFGAYNAALGLAALPAGLLTGWLWTRQGGAAALSVSAGLGLIATALLLLFGRRLAVSGLSRG